MLENQKQMSAMSKEIKVGLENFNNAIVNQKNKAVVDFMGVHLKAYLEAGYLKNKSAKEYEDQFKNLPRVARPQLKDIKKREVAISEEKKLYLIKKWENQGFEVQDRRQNVETKIKVRKAMEQRKKANEEKKRRGFVF